MDYRRDAAKRIGKGQIARSTKDEGSSVDQFALSRKYRAAPEMAFVQGLSADGTFVNGPAGNGAD